MRLRRRACLPAMHRRPTCSRQIFPRRCFGLHALNAAGRNGGDAVFTVRDHGIGIPAKDLPHLFESFSRGSNVADAPGTGLGLSIVERCVHLHAGTVAIESEQGHGTLVTVRLPLFIPLL